MPTYFDFRFRVGPSLLCLSKFISCYFLFNTVFHSDRMACCFMLFYIYTPKLSLYLLSLRLSLLPRMHSVYADIFLPILQYSLKGNLLSDLPPGKKSLPLRSSWKFSFLNYCNGIYHFIFCNLAMCAFLIFSSLWDEFMSDSIIWHLTCTLMALSKYRVRQK